MASDFHFGDIVIPNRTIPGINYQRMMVVALTNHCPDTDPHTPPCLVLSEVDTENPDNFGEWCYTPSGWKLENE